MTTPSNACNLDLSPSFTLTETVTVSPGLKIGKSSLSCDFSNSSMIWDGLNSCCLGTILASLVSSSLISCSSNDVDSVSSAGTSSAGASSSAGAASSAVCSYYECSYYADY